jgi:lactoylglutathione lyase
MVLVVASSLLAQTSTKRPHIFGIAHVAVYVSDLGKSRAFYKNFLGFDEAFSLKRPDGTERIVSIKINDDQYLELFAEETRADGQLSHIAISTDDAAGMKNYLVSRGVFVPDEVHKGQTGNHFFTVQDPDGHYLEIVESKPDSLPAQTKGKFMPATRISNRILHAGILVGAVGPAMKFYRDILGFREFWRGSSADNQQSWISMRAPDGDDYLELMLYQQLPPPRDRGIQNHICLEISDLAKAVAELKARVAGRPYPYPYSIEVLVGKDNKHQANLLDPDGTRIELLERSPVDSKRATASTMQKP